MKKTKPSPFFPNAEDLQEINVYFADHCINKHNTMQYFGCQLQSKLHGEAMASKLKKLNLKLKCLQRQSRHLIKNLIKKPIGKCTNPTIFWLACILWSPLFEKNLKVKLPEPKFYPYLHRRPSCNQNVNHTLEKQTGS